MRARAASAGAVALGALILSWPALYNGFPLIYTDTGTYIESAFTLRLPPDRPLGYSLFIRGTGGCRSLWATVFAQSFLLSFLLRRLFWRVAPRRGDGAFLAACALLAAMTGLPWIMGTVFADAITAPCLLSLLLLLLPGGGAAEAAACAAVVVASSAVHFSHLSICVLVFGCLAVCTAVWRRARGPLRGIRFALPAATLAASCLFAPALNALLGWGFHFSRAGNILLMMHIWDNGILKRFLDEHCADGRYDFCRFKDEVKGGGGFFVWDPRSPLYKTGGWEAPHEEYRRIVADSMVALPGMWIGKTAGAFATQLLMFDACDAVGPRTPRTWAYQVLERRFPGDFKAFLASRQQRDALPLRVFLIAQYGAVVASLGVLAAVLILRREAACGPFRIVLCFAAAAIATNAAVCASISTLSHRYGARVIWFVPLCALLMHARRSGE